MTSRLGAIADKCKMLDALLDEWLAYRAKYPEEFDDSDEEDITNPLDAPPEMYNDGEHGGPPEKIHDEE
jgi:hypothetical protein